MSILQKSYSTKEAEEYKACTRKKKYHSVIQAEEASKRLKKKFKKKYKIYLCKFCDHYHLASKRKKTKK